LPFVTVESDLQPGDLLISTGLGGVFPPGYPVAQVTRIKRAGSMFATVDARPTAGLDRAREVLLVWFRAPPASAPVAAEAPPEASPPGSAGAATPASRAARPAAPSPAPPVATPADRPAARPAAPPAASTETSPPAAAAPDEGGE
jgi:rod shape-determining protein MreC